MQEWTAGREGQRLDDIVIAQATNSDHINDTLDPLITDGDEATWTPENEELSRPAGSVFGAMKTGLFW